MKIIQMGGGYKPEELMHYKIVITANCMWQMRVICVHMEKAGIAFDSPENEVSN